MITKFMLHSKCKTKISFMPYSSAVTSRFVSVPSSYFMGACMRRLRHCFGLDPLSSINPLRLRRLINHAHSPHLNCRFSCFDRMADARCDRNSLYCRRITTIRQDGASPRPLVRLISSVSTASGFSPITHGACFAPRQFCPFMLNEQSSLSDVQHLCHIHQFIHTIPLFRRSLVWSPPCWGHHVTFIRSIIPYSTFAGSLLSLHETGTHLSSESSILPFRRSRSFLSRVTVSIYRRQA
jgi:hypothetical protein